MPLRRIAPEIGMAPCSSAGIAGVPATAIGRPTTDSAGSACPVEMGHSLLSGRWRLTIALALCRSSLRLGGLCVRIQGMSANMLTRRLRQVHETGSLVRDDAGLYRTPRRTELSRAKEPSTTWGRKRIRSGALAPIPANRPALSGGSPKRYIARESRRPSRFPTTGINDKLPFSTQGSR